MRATGDARRGRGRPSLYERAHCERVIELASEGCGRAEIAAALSVSRKTLTAWSKAHPEFRDALTQARDLEYAWWLKQGRERLKQSWNSVSWALQMRNRFGENFSGWGEGPAKTKRKGASNAEQLRAEIERKLSRIAEARAEEQASEVVQRTKT